MSEKVGRLVVVNSTRVPEMNSVRSPRFNDVREEFECFDVGDKVVVILESEYERLKRLDERIRRYAESIDKADYD